MKLWARLLLLPILCAAYSNATATLAISGTVLIDPDPSILLRGQTATVTYTITNTGDEPLEFAYAQTDYVTLGPESSVFPHASAASPPCVVIDDSLSPLPPGKPSYYFNFTQFHPMPLLPGGTRQCVVEITVSGEADGPFIQWFGLHARLGTRYAATVSQSFLFTLGGRAAPVPTLSRLGLSALLLGLLAAGAVFTRTFHTNLNAVADPSAGE